MDGLRGEDIASAFQAVLGRPPGIAPSALAAAAAPEHSIAVRDRIGGPAPASLAASLARYRATLADAEHHLSGVTGRWAIAKETLETAVASRISPE